MDGCALGDGVCRGSKRGLSVGTGVMGGDSSSAECELLGGNGVRVHYIERKGEGAGRR
jgi:hypothetical protein